MPLLTVDVVGTMGDPVGNPAHLLAALADEERATLASEINRWFLNVQPELDQGTINAVAGYLRFPPSEWPANHDSGFRAYDYADAALAELRDIGDVVAVSNLSILGGPALVQSLDEQLGGYIARVYTSYALRARKPHPVCWTTPAADRGVPLSEVIHLGDLISEDVLGALNAGCAGAVLVRPHEPIPPSLAADPRVAVVEDLRGAAAAVTKLWATRPTRNVDQ